jgi:hypothetical protein
MIGRSRWWAIDRHREGGMSGKLIVIRMCAGNAEVVHARIKLGYDGIAAVG